MFSYNRKIIMLTNFDCNELNQIIIHLIINDFLFFQEAFAITQLRLHFRLVYPAQRVYIKLLKL